MQARGKKTSCSVALVAASVVLATLAPASASAADEPDASHAPAVEPPAEPADRPIVVWPTLTPAHCSSVAPNESTGQASSSTPGPSPVSSRTIEPFEQPRASRRTSRDGARMGGPLRGGHRVTKLHALR